MSLTRKSPARVNRSIVFKTRSCVTGSVSIKKVGLELASVCDSPSLTTLTTLTFAINRPCTLGKAAAIQRFSCSVFISFVIKPFRNGTASDPLTRMRPREERSMRPAPPSRTVLYSADTSPYDDGIGVAFCITSLIFADGASLECAALSALWPAATCRSLVRYKSLWGPATFCAAAWRRAATGQSGDKAPHSRRAMLRVAFA
jgi:hypothetical protein